MRYRLQVLAVLIGGPALLLGCSKKGTRTEDFTPPAEKARGALEAALNHWQAGNLPGTVPGTSPAIEIVDSKWKAGQKLKSYEIVSEELGTETRFFKVRLTLASGAPQEVRYAVLGIDPLWVYREEDYKQLSGAGK
jgi:hypothetical protein